MKLFGTDITWFTSYSGSFYKDNLPWGSADEKQGSKNKWF